MALTAVAALAFSAALPASAETKSMHVGQCIGSTGTSSITGTTAGFGETRFIDPDCYQGWLWGYAITSGPDDYICHAGWKTTSPARCSYGPSSDSIISMAHSHDVCDSVTWTCHGSIGTSDS